MSFGKCVRVHDDIRKPFGNKNIAGLAAVRGQQWVILVDSKIDANMEASRADLVPIAPGCLTQRSSKRSEALEAVPRVCGTPGRDGKEYGEDDGFFPEFD